MTQPYTVSVELEPMRLVVEASSEEEALAKAYVKFYHEIGGGQFEITNTSIIEE